MIKKPNRIIFGLLGLLMLFFFGSGCGLDLSRLLPEQTMDPISPTPANRTISQNFEEKLVWRKNHITIRRGFFPSPGLLAGYGYVAYVNFRGGPLSIINQLDVLEANIGTMLWQSERFPTHEDVAISKDRAFVLLYRGSPLNIYDLKGDSKPFSSFNYFKAPTKFYLFPPVVEGNIHIYYIQRSAFSLHALDLTGKEVSPPRRIPAFDPLSNLFLFDQPFLLSTGQGYHGGNVETGEELWRIPSLGRVDSWPVLRDNTLIISAGDGKLLWR
jgi:hypothetical protein